VTAEMLFKNSQVDNCDKPSGLSTVSICLVEHEVKKKTQTNKPKIGHKLAVHFVP